MAAIPQASEHRSYYRFASMQRFEHMILLVTFTGLALTGIPQRYAEYSWAQTMIAVLGGIESIRIVHRILATILMAESIYHGGILTYKLYVLRQQASMLPGLRDMRDTIHWVLFNLGLRRSHPHLPRYNFGEKVEYLAVVWGTAVMILTGFIMWNPIAATRNLPGQVIPAARAAHSAEAVLAVLSILVWHMYNVHIRRFNRSMFTGYITRDAMEEEHGEELETLESGQTPLRPPAEFIKRRKRVFYPFAVVITLVLLVSLYYFVTLENTALTTLAERQVVPSSDIDFAKGDVIQGSMLWVSEDCMACHGAAGDGGYDPLGVSLFYRELTPEQFVEQTRVGPADMPAYPKSRLSDEAMAHLWAWFASKG